MSRETPEPARGERDVETEKALIVLPERERDEHYSRQAVPAEMQVPELY